MPTMWLRTLSLNTTMIQSRGAATVRYLTIVFIVSAPLIILGVDYLVLVRYGYDATITGVIRSWAEKGLWAEAVFLVGVLILWLHLFRGVL